MELPLDTLVINLYDINLNPTRNLVYMSNFYPSAQIGLNGP
jgi:hypothetical protein